MATIQGAFPQTAVKNDATRRPSQKRWAIALFALMFFAALVVWYRPLWVFDRVTQAKLALVGMHHEEVVLDGQHIHYLVGGQGSPVLLVHGLGSRATDWADLIPTIVRSGHRVYAIDLLGYGESDKPKDADYSIPQESKIVEEFLVAKDLQHVDLPDGRWADGSRWWSPPRCRIEFRS